MASDPDIQALIEFGQVQIVKSREVIRKKVIQRIMTGAEILEENEWRGKFIEFTRSNSSSRLFIEPRRLLEQYQANRVSVNGFRISLPKLSQVFRRGKRYIAAILDIDVRGDSEITYNLPRGRFVEKGILIVRRALRDAVLAGLKDLGIHEKLSSETRKLLGSGALSGRRSLYSKDVLLSEGVKRLDDESILSAVKK